MQFQGSEKAILDQLKPFSIPSTESSVLKSEWIEYRPIGQVTDGSPIEFRICPQENQYVDLKRSLLKLKFKVIKTDGTDVGPDDKGGIINNFIHSMFTQDDILLNQVLVSPSSNNYPYKAYVDDVLKVNTDNSKIQETWLYYKDTGDMDSTDVLTGSNIGLTERYAKISASRSSYAVGPLKSDLCNLERWILPDVDIAIRLWQSSSPFRLVKPA